MDWGQVGQWITAAGMAIAGGYAWWLKRQQDAAKTRAVVAESSADSAVADAQTTVYKLLNERLTTLESELRGLRAELAEERRHSRKLEIHIWRLESLMRKANLEVPEFDYSKS